MAAGNSIPIPSYIFANTGTTFTNINALTIIATENIIEGYIKADLIFFLIASFFSNDSTIFSKNTSNLPLASPALIKLTYTLSNRSGNFSKHLDNVTPPSKLFLISSTTSFIAGLSNWSRNIARTCKIGSPAFTMVANCFEKISTSSTFAFFFPKRENPGLFFLSFLSFLVFFELRTKLVIIIFCSFNLCEASSELSASISPSTYFPSEIPLYVKASIMNYIILSLKLFHIL